MGIKASIVVLVILAMVATGLIFGVINKAATLNVQAEADGQVATLQAQVADLQAQQNMASDTRAMLELSTHALDKQAEVAEYGYDTIAKVTADQNQTETKVVNVMQTPWLALGLCVIVFIVFLIIKAAQG